LATTPFKPFVVKKGSNADFCRARIAIVIYLLGTDCGWAAVGLLRLRLLTQRRARAQYQKDEEAGDLCVIDLLGRILNNDRGNFWAEVKRISSCNSNVSNEVDALRRASRLSRVADETRCVANGLNVIIHDDFSTFDGTLSASESKKAVNKLRPRKGAAVSDISSEHCFFSFFQRGR
jgi:hypothetical protein